ncbi:hypothetical protein ACFPRL_29030 [Pseudoclavibacter helvolus]
MAARRPTRSGRCAPSMACTIMSSSSSSERPSSAVRPLASTTTRWLHCRSSVMSVPRKTTEVPVSARL